MDFDHKKFSTLRPRIIDNITECQKKLHKIHQKNKDEKSFPGSSSLLDTLAILSKSISNFPQGLGHPEIVRKIPVFFLQIISFLNNMPQYDEFQFKLDLLDCIDEILLLFLEDPKVQYFQFQCYFLKTRELLSRTIPDIEKMTALAVKLTVDSCDPLRHREHQLLIFGTCESYIHKFNHLKTPQMQDKFIPVITSLARKIIYIHEKNPDRMTETVNQILIVSSFFLCLKGSDSIKSQLVCKGTEEIVLNLNRIVLSYEKSKAALPSMEECLSILTKLNKIITAAEALKNLDIKLLNWLLQAGKVFFLQELYNHADISRFQELLNKYPVIQTCTERFLHEEKRNDFKQQEQKVKETALKTPKILAEGNSPLVEKLQQEIHQKKAELQLLTDKNNSLKTEVRSLNLSLTKNSKKYDTAVSQIEDLNKKIQTSEQKILQLEQDLSKAEKQLLAQQTEYATQARLNEQIISELKNEIKKGGEVHNDLRFICHSLTLDKTELQRKLEILTVELRKQKQDNLQMRQKHDQVLNSNEAEKDLIIRKYEAEKKADDRAKTKQFLSLHEEIARLKIKAGEADEQSPPPTQRHQEISFQQELRPWSANFQFTPGLTPTYVPSFSPLDPESDDQVCGF